MGQVVDFIKDLSTVQIIGLAGGGIPIFNPLKLTNQAINSVSKDTDIGSPQAPPEIPTILTDDVIQVEEKKRKKAGRLSTQTTTPGSLSDISTYKPTLLGG